MNANDQLNDGRSFNEIYAHGWLATMRLGFRPQGRKTVLYHRCHSGPLMVQRPFYPEGEICHVYVLHPPGGLVGGDQLAVEIHLEREARALITTPGATKFYRSAGLSAVLRQQFYLKAQSSLEWLPQDNLFFPDVQAKLYTHFHLEEGAKLFAWENLCLGLPVMNKSLNRGTLVTQLQIWQAGMPLLHEHLRIINGDLSILANYPLVATLVVAPANSRLLQLARKVTEYQPTAAGATLLDTLLVVRILSHNNLHMQTVLRRLWRILRPEVIGRISCPPRIWST